MTLTVEDVDKKTWRWTPWAAAYYLGGTVFGWGRWTWWLR